MNPRCVISIVAAFALAACGGNTPEAQGSPGTPVVSSPPSPQVFIMDATTTDTGTTYSWRDVSAEMLDSDPFTVSTDVFGTTTTPSWLFVGATQPFCGAGLQVAASRGTAEAPLVAYVGSHLVTNVTDATNQGSVSGSIAWSPYPQWLPGLRFTDADAVGADERLYWAAIFWEGWKTGREVDLSAAIPIDCP